MNSAPGFAAAPGPKAIGFSARASKAGLGATMTVEWRTAAGALIASDTLTLASLSPHRPGRPEPVTGQS